MERESLVRLRVSGLSAEKLLNAAREKGIRMPEEMSIIGCDNLFCSPYLVPALTSVDTHQQKIGSRAVEMLIHRENAREQGDWELVIRDSCARVKS